MNRQQIFEILSEVFIDFDLFVFDKGTWSKIKIDPFLEVYTYSGYPEQDSTWYFNAFYNGHSKETMIPGKNTKEFIQIYYDIYKDIVVAREIYQSVNEKLNSIDTTQNIRDRRITNIINYD